jgi:hypothetical protein
MEPALNEKTFSITTKNLKGKKEYLTLHTGY